MMNIEKGSDALWPVALLAVTFRLRVCGVIGAVPLNWSELKLPQRPMFSIGNFDEWKSRLKKDPWAKLPTTHQKIAAETLK